MALFGMLLAHQDLAQHRVFWLAVPIIAMRAIAVARQGVRGLVQNYVERLLKLRRLVSLPLNPTRISMKAGLSIAGRCQKTPIAIRLAIFVYCQNLRGNFII